MGQYSGEHYGSLAFELGFLVGAEKLIVQKGTARVFPIISKGCQEFLVQLHKYQPRVDHVIGELVIAGAEHFHAGIGFQGNLQRDRGPITPDGKLYRLSDLFVFGDLLVTHRITAVTDRAVIGHILAIDCRDYIVFLGQARRG